MKNYPGGVWPVMLTPYAKNGEIDEQGLRALVEWYISRGVSGLFASCQSSEIYKLTAEERIRIAKITLDAAAGRVPVVASGHVSDDFDTQVRELSAMAETGVDAVILITNHLAREDESDDVWLSNLETLMNRLDPAVSLGAYECPAPYKRLLSPRVIAKMAETKRFYFLKDTCCLARDIREKIRAAQNSPLKVYNANSSTLLQSLRDGAAGFSGVMANFHPELYVWLTQNPNHPNAEKVQAALAIASLIERQCYPVNAKYHLQAIENLPITTFSRVRDENQLDATAKAEVHMLNDLMHDTYARYCE